MQSVGQKTGGDIVVMGTAVLRAGWEQPGGGCACWLGWTQDTGLSHMKKVDRLSPQYL